MVGPKVSRKRAGDHRCLASIHDSFGCPHFRVVTADHPTAYGFWHEFYAGYPS